MGVLSGVSGVMNRGTIAVNPDTGAMNRTTGAMNRAPTGVYRSRLAFVDVFKAEAKRRCVKIPTAVQKAILSALSERDEDAEVCLVKGAPEPDTDLRDSENVPLKEDIAAYMVREVLPHVPDAWVDHGKTRVGYEIPFTRHFYVYEPPRPLGVIEAEIRELEGEIQGMLAEVLG